MKEMIDDVMEAVSADEQYFRDLFKAQKLKTPSDMFNDWLYQNYPIGNGHMLVELTENPAIQTTFLRDNNLPLDTEL